jgi:membrane-bound serine protease (ClpP class)
MLKASTIIVLFTLVFGANLVWAQESTRVLQLNLKADIDPRTSRYMELGLDKAAEEAYDIVFIEMDTYGGLVTDAKDIVEKILDSEIPVYVFINKDAASAGALISIACDSIYMSPGASMGAATVVVGDGSTAPDKYQSYMRSTMRSTAEQTGRDPAIAEAMVDQSIEIEGVTEEGQVLTFTTSEAIKFGFCEGQYTSINEALRENGILEYSIDVFSLSASEKIIAVFLNPVLSGILILLIVGGIYFELQTPGVGFPIIAAVAAAILYFIPYYLNGLAANWEIIAFVIGIILIGIEILVIPGFGVAGVSGIVLIVGSLTLVMLDNDVFDFSLVPFQNILTAFATTLSGLVGGMFLIFFGGVKFSQSKFFQKVALTTVEATADGYVSNFIEINMTGKTGTAFTVLRPSGKVQIDSEIYDAFTRGEYIDKGTSIEVIDQESSTLQVRSTQS